MKYFKYIGILSLLIFSFYLTDFATELAINSNPLMQSIKSESDSYLVMSVNATIENNTIIPGIKGKKVNEMESFINMKDFGAFNENHIIYDYFKPEISIEDNKDKVIISGNTTIRQISLLVDNNKEIINYLKKNNIKYSKLLSIDEEIDFDENINIESSKKKFNDLDTLLNKKNLNKKICILDYSNIENCMKKQYYIVKPNIIVKNDNIVNSLNSIDKGSIILIDDKLNINNLNLILKKISNLDLKIVYLSEIIKE